MTETVLDVWDLVPCEYYYGIYLVIGIFDSGVE